MKKYLTKHLSSLILLLGYAILLPAQNAGKNGIAMLKVDVDSRAAAMAGAYTALANDAAAVFWNPAGLVASAQKSLIVMHNEWIADITQEFAAVHFITGKHNLAASINLMTIPDIEIRGNTPSQEPDGKVSAFTFSAALSYARAISKHWSWGLSFKYLFEKYYLEQAPGWAVDFGLRKNELVKHLDWGFSIQNLGQMSALKDRKTPLPLILRNGFIYHLTIPRLKRDLHLAADLQYIKDENYGLRLGTEFEPWPYLALRLGWIVGSQANQPTMGLGIHYVSYHLDYAYVPLAEGIGQSHRLSFGMNF